MLDIASSFLSLAHFMPLVLIREHGRASARLILVGREQALGNGSKRAVCGSDRLDRLEHRWSWLSPPHLHLGAEQMDQFSGESTRTRPAHALEEP